jgi:hypothetical protein
MRYYWFMLGVLGTWRVTHLLQGEDGPGDLLVRFRRWVGSGFGGKLLDCFDCLSLWISAPFAVWLGEAWPERFLLWLGLSGAAILLELLTHRNETLPAPYNEESEEPH